MSEPTSQLFHFTFAFLLSTVIGIDAGAQKINLWLHGTLITTENDTLVGLIEDEIEGKNVAEYQFKKGDNSKIQKIEKSSVKHIWFENGIMYDRVPSIKGDELANALVTGEVNLYKRLRNRSKTYFLLEKNRTVILTEKAQPTISTAKLELEGADIFVIDRTRLDTSMNNLYGQCAEERTYKFKLKNRFLKDAVINLNNCLESDYQIHPKKRLVHKVSLLLGQSFYNREFFDGFKVIGFHYSRVNLRYKKRSSFLSSLHYLTRKLEGERIHTFNFAPAYKHKFSYGMIQPYFYVGLSLIYSHSSESGSSYGVLPINLGVGLDIPVNQDFAIQADISFTSILIPTIGVAYYIRQNR